jgi:hypothetical protein
MSVRVRAVATDEEAAGVDCGQWALAYTTHRPLAEVVAAVGHTQPMRLREVVAGLERAGMPPRVLHATALDREAADLWWSHGGEGFLAILAEIDRHADDAVGHCVVLHGRTLFDPAMAPVARRVSPRVLRDYALALVVSDGGHP